MNTILYEEIDCAVLGGSVGHDYVTNSLQMRGYMSNWTRCLQIIRRMLDWSMFSYGPNNTSGQYYEEKNTRFHRAIMMTLTSW